MVIVTTKSGSTYEVAEDGTRIRMIARPETRGGSRRLASGEWLPCVAVLDAEVGRYMKIVFGNDDLVTTSKVTDVCWPEIEGN